jgi:y4mF family transcriptional regulator
MQPIHTPREIGQLIRRARKAQGLRQPDLAGACGTSVRFIVEVERGKPTAQIGKVLDVLRMLGIRVLLEGGDAASA